MAFEAPLCNLCTLKSQLHSHYECEWCLSLSHSAPLSLDSVLCNFIFTSAYKFSTHNVLMMSLMMFSLLAPTLHLTNGHRPGIFIYSGVPIKNKIKKKRGRPNYKNANFYTMFKYI